MDTDRRQDRSSKTGPKAPVLTLMKLSAATLLWRCLSIVTDLLLSVESSLLSVINQRKLQVDKEFLEFPYEFHSLEEQEGDRDQ